MKALKLKLKLSAQACLLLLVLAGSFGNAAMAEECVPESDGQDMTAGTIPAEFPTAIPLPGEHFVMNAMATPADEWNPYPNATVELLVKSNKDDMFRFYEEKLPAAGYRIVMWEKDEGATGIRFRGEGIDQAMITFNDYDCQAYVMINVSLLP